MKILSFETATEACSAALLIDKEILQEFKIAPRGHAELLLSMIDRLLKQAKINQREIDAVAFGCGPGSFMGVRIATGIAQGIAYGLQRPVIPVSTLQALAQVAHDQHSIDHAIVGWDARMNEIYWGAYCLDENQIMQPVQEDQLSPPQSISFSFEGHPWIGVGNAWKVYENQFQSLDKNLDVLPHKLYPSAKGIAKIAASQYHDPHYLLSPLKVEPTYLRNKVAWKPNEIKN